MADEICRLFGALSQRVLTKICILRRFYRRVAAHGSASSTGAPAGVAARPWGLRCVQDDQACTRTPCQQGLGCTQAKVDGRTTPGRRRGHGWCFQLLLNPTARVDVSSVHLASGVDLLYQATCAVIDDHTHLSQHFPLLTHESGSFAHLSRWAPHGNRFGCC